jgi:Protein of unknown function (DUF3300)
MERMTAILRIAFAVCFLVALLAGRGQAQDEQQAAAAPEGGAQLSEDELRILVAPIAFYPDDVLAVVLPASTTGLQIVQAKQYLDKHKADASLKPNDNWDPSVLALLNYPDVIDRLNADLDWTQKLGDAVLDQQADVMNAIQQARNEAVAAGYLKSDDKQVITQEKETVVIQSADPQVVYVPQYDPQVVVQQSYATYPPPAYYPPYQPYYAPGATFFAGALTGAAFAYAFNWHDNDINVNGCCGGGNNNININNNFNKFDVDRTNIGNGNNSYKWGGDKQRQRRNQEQARTRQNGRSPAGVAPARGGIGQNQGGIGQNKAGPGQNKARVGDQGAAKRGGANSGLGAPQRGRDTAKQSQRGNQSMQGGGGANLKSRQPAGGGGVQAQPRQRQGGGGAFGGVGNGRQTGGASNRGHKSMSGAGIQKRR